MGRSRSFSGIQPPEGPPVCAALNFFLFGTPPPTSKISSLRVIPIGTSTSPVLFTFPAKAKTLVPLLVSVPIPAYHSGPLSIILATLAQVSTLLILVGFPQRPETAGKG